MTSYHLELRAKRSRGSGRGKFGGPDTYVAVQIVPDNVEPLYALNQKVAAKRGIKLVYFGEGYHKHSGKRSMLGQAIARAQAFIDAQEEKLKHREPKIHAVVESLNANAQYTLCGLMYSLRLNDAIISYYPRAYAKKEITCKTCLKVSKTRHAHYY